MKALNIIAWGSAGLGILIILLGFIAILFNFNILGVEHFTNFFLAANNCFLITIALFIYLKKCNCKEG